MMIRHSFLDESFSRHSLEEVNEFLFPRSLLIWKRLCLNLMVSVNEISYPDDDQGKIEMLIDHLETLDNKGLCS
jgi:hypothetical protein